MARQGFRKVAVACQADEHLGRQSPFDSLYKLIAVVRKCSRNEQHMEWVLTVMVDQCLNGKAGLSSTSALIAIHTLTMHGGHTLMHIIGFPDSLTVLGGTVVFC